MLPSRPIQVHIKPHPVHLNDLGRLIGSHVLTSKLREGKAVWNDAKVRLSSDLTSASVKSGMPAILQKTDFFTNLCTNEQTFTRFKSRAGDLLVYNGTELIARNGALLDLADSQCGNEIGISTIAIASDAKMIVLAQGDANVYSPGSLAPSGSGGADWDDLTPRPRSLQEFVVRAVEREFREECGLGDPNGAFGEKRMRTCVIGFARFVDRGGKPEFFCSTIYTGLSDDVRRRGVEKVFVANQEKSFVGDAAQGVDPDTLRQWRTENLGYLSLSLYVNLLFLESFARHCPDWFRPGDSTRIV